MTEAMPFLEHVAVNHAYVVTMKAVRQMIICEFRKER